MSRYIDAGVLMRALAEMWYDSPISVTGISVSELINKQPSIDIVRCKECKYWCKGDEVYGICNRCANTRQMRYDDFCSRGEREGE